MKLPLQITFRRLESSEAMESKIRQRVDELDRFYDKIMSCHVVVEPQHQHHQQGNLYQVRIDMTVPGKVLTVNRESDKHHAYRDVYIAIRDAFDAMRRQLEDYVRRQRGDIKAHATPAHGKIAVLVPEQDFGRIVTPDGRDIYFHRNSIVNGSFDDLDVGSEVRFSEESGELGPQASTVNIVGKHHVVG